MDNNSANTSEELLILLRENPEKGIAIIYQRYWNLLLDAAYRRVQDQQESQEIVQELLISLYTKRNELHSNTTLEAYLRNALKYKVIDHMRHRMTRERYAQAVASRPEYTQAEAEQHMDDAELSYRLRQATDQLPPKCKEVFILSKLEHMSNAHIAQKLGISVSMVEKHISRGMELMRKYLGKPNNALIALALMNAIYRQIK